MAVVPSGLDQQPAGVPVPGERDVPAVLLITGGVLRRVIPSHAASSRGCENRAKSPISAINPSAVMVAIPRKRVRICTWAPHRSLPAISARRASSVSS